MLRTILTSCSHSSRQVLQINSEPRKLISCRHHLVKQYRPITTTNMVFNISPAKRIEGIDKNVWIEFTTLAAEHKAVNLGQGFPDFSPPTYLKEILSKLVVNGDEMMNQYTRGFGHPKLVQNLSKLFSPLIGVPIDPYKEILISVGAYGALFASIMAFVEPGDEVIIVEPFFDCYLPMVKLTGGVAKFVPLRPKSTSASRSEDWGLNPEELSAAFTHRTKAIVINTPNNPLGKVFSRDELREIADLCIQHDCLCISDEVYEWLQYDGHKHTRIASMPGMWERTITIGSAGKTFSMTGWKIGWSIAPAHIMKHLQTVSQNSTYNCPTPLQEAVAQGLEVEMGRMGEEGCYFNSLPRELEAKRDRLALILTEVGMKPIIPQGGYFMLADTSSIEVDLSDSADSGESYDYRLVKWLIRNKKVATIPNSAFYSPEHKSIAEKYIRFCFCKKDETISQMATIFREWAKTM